MVERLSELFGRVQESRLRLEDLAEQAAQLRNRLRADTALVDSLQRLTQSSERGGQRSRPEPLGADGRPFSDGGDGHLVSDAWEIALINEEGK